MIVYMSIPVSQIISPPVSGVLPSICIFKGNTVTWAGHHATDCYCYLDINKQSDELFPLA